MTFDEDRLIGVGYLAAYLQGHGADVSVNELLRRVQRDQISLTHARAIATEHGVRLCM